MWVEALIAAGSALIGTVPAWVLIVQGRRERAVNSAVAQARLEDRVRQLENDGGEHS